MKTPKVSVTVNHGEYLGQSGILIGYDRNKYYEVLFDNGECESFKGYYLDGIENLKGHGRYYLQYNSSDGGEYMTHKQLSDDRREHINKGKGSGNRKFRSFSFNVLYEDELIHTKGLSLNELRKKIRFAMNNKLSFNISIILKKRNQSTLAGLIEFTTLDDTIGVYTLSKSEEKLVASAKRSIIKVINEY